MVDRPTIADLAEKAGVSVATVDRVINRRLPVRGDTATRVIAAAEAIGFHAAGLLKKRVAELPKRRLGFLLQKNDNFYQYFGRELIAAATQSNEMEARPIVEYMETVAPAYVGQRLIEMAPKVDAVAVVAMEHPLVIQALEKIALKRKPAFSLLASINSTACNGFLGLDGNKIGRIAGWTVSRLAKRPGKVCILVGSRNYINQELADINFRSYMRQHAPQFELMDSVVNLDDVEIAYEAVSKAIAQHDDLVAVYASGGGQDGLIRALRECDSARKPIAVCNELTPNVRAALADGVVDLSIRTPVELLARRVVVQMAKACAASGTQHFPPYLPSAELYMSENI